MKKTILVRFNMQLTRAGEYGILGLLCLARRPLGQTVMVEEVSQEEHISKDFLGKIFQSLARHGIIRSSRGAKGGFSLVKSPETITTLEVVEAIEGRIALQRCLAAVPDCSLQSHCALCLVLERVQDRVKDVLANTTLADLVKTEAAMSGERRRRGVVLSKGWPSIPAVRTNGPAKAGRRGIGPRSEPGAYASKRRRKATRRARPEISRVRPGQTRELGK